MLSIDCCYCIESQIQHHQCLIESNDSVEESNEDKCFTCEYAMRFEACSNMFSAEELKKHIALFHKQIKLY